MPNHKIIAPALPAGIVQRDRLFQLLKNNPKPVVWVSGPGGSGKTTLVSSYLEANKLPALWYLMDHGDADPATFFYYMTKALSLAVPGGEPLPLLTPEYLAGMATFARRYFARLFAQLPAPYAIVLDNYQDLAAGSPFHELLMEGLSLIPEGVTVFALSRSEPPPVFTVQGSVERIQFLGWRELRLSFDEAKQVAGAQSAGALEAGGLARLYTKTDGWIAGLLLILESLKGGAVDYQQLEKMPLDKVFRFFADKIFDSGEPELQGFLLKTAFASGVTARMAEQLTGSASAEQILSRLCRNRFFTDRCPLADSIYLYHPLFREFLMARAESAFAPAELREIRRRTSALLEQAGRTEEAADLLFAAGDWEGMTELILKSAPLYAAGGRSETVRLWLESLPGSTVDGNPGLLYWQGVCLLLHSPAQSRVCFRKAFELYRGADDVGGMCVSWSGGAHASLYDGEFTPLDQWLSLLEETKLGDVGLPGQLEEQVALSAFNAMAFRQPQHPDLSRWRERAIPMVREGADPNLRLQSAVHLIVHDLWTGDFGRAGLLLEQTLAMARSGKITPMTQITVMNAQVLHAFFTGACAEGVTLALDALRLADETGVHVWDSQLLGNGASCALSRGDLAAAHDLLKGMELRLERCRKRLDVGQYHALRGWQAILKGDLCAVSPHLELALQSFHAVGFVAVECLALTSVAEHHREAGNAPQAQTYLRRAYELARGMKSEYLEFICLCNDTQLALAAGDEERAATLLRQAMALGRAGSYLNGWLWLPGPLIRLCTRALEWGIEVEYVRQLIRSRCLVPETPPLHLETWPWPLKIRTLGCFELVRDDVPVPLTGKVKKPLELLKALVALGGSNVAQERLTDALWPDVDGDLAQRSFETTLHRLRKTLGNEKVLLLQGGRLSLNSRYCWVDTWAFQRCCVEAEAAVSDAASLPPQFEKGIELYQGCFLPGDADQPWSIPLRQRLRSACVELLNRGGRHCEALGLWAEAAALYRKAIEEEGLCEELHQRLMVCYRQLGQTAQAVQAYQGLRSSLSSRLGIDPAPQTEEIYRTLTEERVAGSPA